MSSLSSWVRLLPGVQPDFLDAAESLDAWHAELERRIACRAQEIADLHKRLADSRSRIETLTASKWTSAQIQVAKATAAPAATDWPRPAVHADLYSPSSTAQH